MVQWGMNKSDAIEILGGSVSAAAKAIGISYQAVAKWPDVLTPRIADRVVAAQSRLRRSASKADRQRGGATHA